MSRDNFSSRSIIHFGEEELQGLRKPYTQFSKTYADISDIDKINKHITDQREKHMEKDEKPITVKYISLHVPIHKEDDIENMFRRHEHILVSSMRRNRHY